MPKTAHFIEFGSFVFPDVAYNDRLGQSIGTNK